ncbi:MAG: cytochrome c3 family protein [Candidatus Poribacteria bacterium]|nr:cytochrome c3 family protein [Candidatus Poribacteria bacterium]
MRPLFSPIHNYLAKYSIAGGGLLVLTLLTLVLIFPRTSHITRVGVAVSQPVPFSHKHHVSGLGIECMYCHSGVEESPYAGVPATKVCMTCHSQVWTNAEILQPIRTSFATETPMKWNRVHDLGKFAYFDHSIHIAKGVGCESCHGRVDTMPLMWKEKPMQMRTCLECHRNPEQHLRPKSEIFTFGYKPDEPQEVVGKRLMQEYGVQPYNLQNCSTCHR